MKLKFYGTRGSAPVCDAGFQEFGGNTTCVRLASSDMQTIVRQAMCTRDEGRPLGLGLQGQSPNHLKLLRLNGRGSERLGKDGTNPLGER